MTTIRTRFAPSPTGYMHIGGMRTALFNWLWARHNGGQFILRIDDTDQERNIEAALAPILQAFRWLGLDWDEGPEVGGPHGPYFQSQRGELYRDAVEKLQAEGKAYRCFETTEQIQADRAAAQAAKRPYLNERRSLDSSDAEIEQFLAEGRPHVVRFLVPREGTVAIDDHVRGHVEWDAGLIPDPVICRANGSPLYNFATVVDDSQLQISHVIRAEEHLSNTPIQVLLHQALGNELPEFAHIPFVTAPGTTRKLSKRDLAKYRNNPAFKRMFEDADRVFPQLGLGDSETLNPVMVEYYERIGYLPAGVLNALSRLGWSLDDKTEIMPLSTVIENFSLDRVVKSPAGLDPEKLINFQSHWMNQLTLDERLAGCLPYLVQAGYVTEPLSAETDELLRKLLPALGDRIKIFSDILNHTDFLVSDKDLTYDEKAFEKRIRAAEDAVGLLQRFRERLANVESFDVATLEETLKGFVEAEGIKIGAIIHAVRLATTGKPNGPGLYDCLAILGRERCLARIDQAVARV